MEEDCITFLECHVQQITLSPWHKPQAAAERNTCHKKEEAHKDAEKRTGGRELARMNQSFRGERGRNTEKARLVFLVSAYLRKVGRTRVNS